MSSKVLDTNWRWTAGRLDCVASDRSVAATEGCKVSKRLLCSIHDVGPRFEREVDCLAELYDRQLGHAKFAMLVVPDHWGEAPLAQNKPFQSRLRSWSDAGVEMFVHGWFHRDTSSHTGLAKFKAGNMTAGEGEFLGLDETEALRRMRDGKALIEDVIGRKAAGFIAPAWLYGPGAKSALTGAGFALAEDHFRVWEPASGKVLSRGPVITWASRTRMRQLSSRFFARVAKIGLAGQRDVRLAVHPGDTNVSQLIQSIDATLAYFAKGRVAARYADLRA